MKRQPIASAAAFFVLTCLQVESHRQVEDSVGRSTAPTDGIFYTGALY